ncbi:hypothetical protein MMC29_003695 [Sticta canariensis]|nr:hypothetical protein [Sticta canariensis]
MPSPPSSRDILFPTLNDCSSQVLDLHGRRPVIGDEDEQSLDREMQSVESRAKSRAIETVNCVSLQQVESGNFGYYGRNPQSAGRDEVIHPTLRQQSNRSNAHPSFELSPESNGRTLRSARRAGPRGPNQPKPRVNFSNRQRQTLDCWVNGHMDDPYPTKDEVVELAAQTELTENQVRDWFTRFRKRNPKRIGHKQSHHLSDASATPIMTDIDRSIVIGEPLKTPMEVESQSPSLQDTWPLDRSSSPLDTYLQTSPQDEPISRSTADTLQSDNNPPYFFTRDGHTPRRQGTVSTTRTGAERTHQLSSQQSVHSVPSSDTAGRPVGKKGQRLVQPPPLAPERQGDKRFQCTVCNRCHQYKSDWIRDEETHNPQEEWICMLQGPRLVCNGDMTCAFCGKFNPTDEHLDSEHNTSLCSKKPVEQRTFKRPDNLHRHINHYHKANIGSPPKPWRVSKHESDTQQFWCGFCSDFLRTTWESRLNHIANHYTEDKYDMTRWSPEPEARDLNESLMLSLATNHNIDVAENLNADGAANPNSDDNPQFNFSDGSNPNSDDNPQFNFSDAANPSSDDNPQFNSSDAANLEFDSSWDPCFDKLISWHDIPGF